MRILKNREEIGCITIVDKSTVDIKCNFKKLTDQEILNVILMFRTLSYEQQQPLDNLTYNLSGRYPTDAELAGTKDRNKAAAG